MQQNIKITKTQIETLRPYIPNIEKLLQHGTRTEIMIEINDAEIANLGDNYNETKESRAIHQVYMEILEQN